MNCKKCNGELPDIKGIIYCPFCKTEIGKLFKSNKHKEYSRMHRQLVGSYNAISIEKAANEVTRGVFDFKKKYECGELSSNRIDLCGNEEITEYWNKLCMSMINVILEKG